MDVVDDGKEYRLVLDVPGATKEGIELKPGPIPGTLQVRVPHAPEPTNGQVLRRERAPRSVDGAYARLIPVAWDANVKEARSSLSNGVLTLVVPKNDAGKDEKKGPHA